MNLAAQYLILYTSVCKSVHVEKGNKSRDLCLVSSQFEICDEYVEVDIESIQVA